MMDTVKDVLSGLAITAFFCGAVFCLAVLAP